MKQKKDGFTTIKAVKAGCQYRGKEATQRINPSQSITFAKNRRNKKKQKKTKTKTKKYTIKKIKKQATQKIRKIASVQPVVNIKSEIKIQHNDHFKRKKRRKSEIGSKFLESRTPDMNL